MPTLQVDISLAKAVAETGPPEDDEQLRRKLWLDIARRVVQQGHGKGVLTTAGRGPCHHSFSPCSFERCIRPNSSLFFSPQAISKPQLLA